MKARKAPELASWDSHLNQKQPNPKWRRSSSSLARDPHHTPLENQSLDILPPSGKFSGQRHGEQSTFRSNLERGSLTNSPTNARLPYRVDTASATSHDIHHSHQASIVRSVPNPASKPSSFITSSMPFHFTPNSSVHTSRTHDPRPASSRGRTAPSQLAESDVIDLTLEDTEDELSVKDMMVPNSTNLNDRYADPGPSRPLSSGRSSSIALEQSLFTPPPPRRRTRHFIDYLAVPSFPKGSTRADYQPMFDRAATPVMGPAVINTLKDSSPVEYTNEGTPEKRQSKERESDVVSLHGKYKQRLANGEDTVPGALLDAFCEHMMIPLYDEDAYPPLTTLDLATNSRFIFAHLWRAHASRLQEEELDWMFKFRPLEKACIWAQEVKTPSPRLPGTASCVSSEQLRPWELVPPESLPQEKGAKHASDEQAHATGSHAALDADVNCLSPPDDASAVLLNSTTSQGLAVVDVEHDMHQYFNGLSDSPSKHVPSRQQPAPTHTPRVHLPQSPAHTQMNSLGLGFSSLEPDPRLADAGDRECFFGVPPSPPPADVEPSPASGPLPDPSVGSANYFAASPHSVSEASPTGTWSFEQGEGLLPDNDASPINLVTSTALGTIDPSLLGPEQSQKPSRPKDSVLKRRSKLPEPVIYIRRPIDSSSLPLLSGKRPVQIKYRDSGDTPVTPSAQVTPDEGRSDLVGNPVGQSKIDTNNSPRTKRRSVPSRKLREYSTTSESASDYIPDLTPKHKHKHKGPSFRDKESVVEPQDTKAKTTPTMSFCHQCRNTSVRPKMLCSNVIHDRVCGKRFCNRCVLYRYPDVTFDEHSAGFLCPVCTNTCNCSVCSRNRGEEFVSMRLGGLAASLLKTKVTLVRDAGKPHHHALSQPGNVDARQSASARTMSTPESGAGPAQPRFWAHVYGIEGERMGSAFMTREHMERLRTRGPSPSPPPAKQPPKKARRPTKRSQGREKPKGPRVFIGRPLESWKVRAVRDLEPGVDVEMIQGKLKKGKERETGMGITSGHHRRRCYVGNPTPLHEPYGRMPGTASPTFPPSRCSTPGLNSEASPAPLPELGADYWPQPEVGECCSWDPPPPPGAIVQAQALSMDAATPLGPFVMERSDPGSPGAVGAWPGVTNFQDQGSGSGVDMDADGRASASAVMPYEDMARAITAALATLDVDQPS